MLIKGLIAGAAIALAGATMASAQDYEKNPIPQANAQAPTTVNPLREPGTEGLTDLSFANQDLTLESGATVIINNQARVPVSTDVAARLGIPIEVVTNGPVPDTPENRARYGQPMSNAGKNTRPVGN